MKERGGAYLEGLPHPILGPMMSRVWELAFSFQDSLARTKTTDVGQTDSDWDASQVGLVSRRTVH